MIKRFLSLLLALETVVDSGPCRVRKCYYIYKNNGS